MIYGNRSNGNQHGLVLTKTLVVEFMLDRIGYVSTSDLSKKVIVEPASGDGAFAIKIIERLHTSSKIFGFSFQEALSNIRLYELDVNMAELLSERISLKLAELSATLPETLIQPCDFLLADPIHCDFLIGNPPYVRHENIPEKEKHTYRKIFRTFTHRSDLYIAFYEKSLRILNKGGVLSFICSNRWLKNQYGLNLRELIGLHYELEEVIDLEGASPFEEDVLAYPAITTIRKSSNSPKADYYCVHTIADLKKLDFMIFPSRKLNVRFPKNWFAYTKNGDEHEKFLDSIENQGFRIGIGVATGCDKVYIQNNFEEIIENELLITILTTICTILQGDRMRNFFCLRPF